MFVNIFRVASLLVALGILAACAGEGGGEGPEGPEGSNEIGGEGPEGPEGGATGGNEPFVSTGMSRGAHQSISLAPDETFAGLLYDIEVAVYYNPVLESFVGRIRNEATEAVCDVRVIVTLDGYRSVNASFSGQPFVLDGLAQFGGTEFEFPASTAARAARVPAAASTAARAKVPAKARKAAPRAATRPARPSRSTSPSPARSGARGSVSLMMRSAALSGAPWRIRPRPSCASRGPRFTWDPAAAWWNWGRRCR